jgi:hypothetical protein
MYRQAAGIPELPTEFYDVLQNSMNATQQQEADILLGLPVVQRIMQQLTGIGENKP